MQKRTVGSAVRKCGSTCAECPPTLSPPGPHSLGPRDFAWGSGMGGDRVYRVSGTGPPGRLINADQSYVLRPALAASWHPCDQTREQMASQLAVDRVPLKHVCLGPWLALCGKAGRPLPAPAPQHQAGPHQPAAVPFHLLLETALCSLTSPGSCVRFRSLAGPQHPGSGWATAAGCLRHLPHLSGPLSHMALIP